MARTRFSLLWSRLSLHVPVSLDTLTFNCRFLAGVWGLVSPGTLPDLKVAGSVNQPGVFKQSEQKETFTIRGDGAEMVEDEGRGVTMGGGPLNDAWLFLLSTST